MRSYLVQFFDVFQYPRDAVNELLTAYDRIAAHEDAYNAFCSQIEKYEESHQIDRDQDLPQAIAAAAPAGVADFHSGFLYYCCCSRHLKELYRARNLPETVWYDSMLDLRIKAYECKAVKGYWGSFVLGWFADFFNLKRFALGRLQFETRNFVADFGGYHGHGICLNTPENMVINVHIPSGSRLPYDQVLDAYRQAYHWFSQYQTNGKLAFACWSWLMYDKLPQIAGENTNTYQFIMDYELLMSQQDADFSDCWRLFDVEYTGDPRVLPRNGGLRKRYAEFLEQGGTAGIGYGIAIFDGEKFLSRRKLP